MTDNAIIQSFVDLYDRASFVISLDGSIIAINHLAAEMFGYSPKELVGQKMEILVPDEVKGEHEQHRANYMKQYKPSDFTVRCLNGQRKNKEIFNIDVMVSLVQNQQQELELIIVSIADTSETDRINAKLETLLEKAKSLSEMASRNIAEK